MDEHSVLTINVVSPDLHLCLTVTVLFAVTLHLLFLPLITGPKPAWLIDALC